MSDRTRKLLIGTSNVGKAHELRQLLDGWHLLTLADFPALQPPPETGETFEANAALKARYYAAHTGLWTLADDSGLEVEALAGAPGIHSARYAGASATDAENVAKLLAELQRTNDPERRARFVCVIALASPDGRAWLFRGMCRGRIAHAPRGDGGFGYDPIFVPEGESLTFSELSAEEKQRRSHRARALAQARDFLLSLRDDEPCAR
ncbi:MAG: non-canonical purine NTP pyrophosphatase, RdgB/HAM1 family [Pyrinomonas sp.]|uniref:RdgB/HAM1 family non-canonical purine NTP pyrophosphatase n=1 Tax=Pyrinomonas sp. TaxID=2080306 RepID=UPI003317683A